jgi:hypothetical protein
MSRWLSGIALGATLLTSVGAGPAEAQERVLVTVRQLFDQDHRLEVPAGTEVVWADPHFERRVVSARRRESDGEARGG